MENKVAVFPRGFNFPLPLKPSSRCLQNTCPRTQTCSWQRYIKMCSLPQGTYIQVWGKRLMIRIQCHLAERNYKRYDISSPGLQSLKQSTGKLQWSQRFPKDGAGQAELTHEAGPDQQQPHLSETTT